MNWTSFCTSTVVACRQLYKNRSSRKIDSQTLLSREYDFLRISFPGRPIFIQFVPGSPPAPPTSMTSSDSPCRRAPSPACQGFQIKINSPFIQGDQDCGLKFDFIDFDGSSIILPSCHAMTSLPNFQLPKQNWVDRGTNQIE